MKREHRQLTRREWSQITSCKPVVHWIARDTRPNGHDRHAKQSREKNKAKEK